MSEFVATVPPWLVLATLLGGALGSLYKVIWPKSEPGSLVCLSLLVVGLTVGHLIAVVGELPSWRLGELRPLPGLALGCLLVLLAKSRRVW